MKIPQAIGYTAADAHKGGPPGMPGPDGMPKPPSGKPSPPGMPGQHGGPDGMDIFIQRISFASSIHQRFFRKIRLFNTFEMWHFELLRWISQVIKKTDWGDVVCF